MPAKLMDYIIKILDYVAETPGSAFEFWNDNRDTDDSRYPRLLATFSYSDRYGRTCHIGRDDDAHWSVVFDVNEDNLKYLLSEIHKLGGDPA